MIEWTGQQQIWLLLQCGGLGFLLGIVYDVFAAVGAHRRRSWPAVFAADVLFFLVAALITFFAALAVMDGRLHPLLFVGSALGFASQHVSIGRVGPRCVLACGRAFCRLLRLVTLPWRWLWRVLRSGMTRLVSPLRKKWKNNRKIFRFFAKNS